MKNAGILTSCCNTFDKLCKNIILILFGLFLFGLSAVSLLFTTYYGLNYNEFPLYKNDHPIILLIIIILALIFLIIFDKFYGIDRINTKKLSAFLLVYTLLVSIVWVFMSRNIPVDDQGIVSSIASQFICGDFSSFEKGGYLYIYPFQLGITAFFEFVYRLVGNNNFLYIELLNCFAACILFYSLYRITDIFFKSVKINNLVLLLSFACFPPIMYCTFVYGSILSLTSSIFAIWMLLEFIEKRKIRFFIISSVSITCAILFKSNSMIALIAMVIIYLLNLIKKRKFIYLVCPIVTVLLVLLSQTALYSIYEHRSGEKKNDGAPKILWVAMGLQEGFIAEGWYNGYSLFPYIDSGYDSEEMTEQAKQSIKDSLHTFNNSPQYFVKFFYYKFVSQWNDPSFQGFWISRNHNDERSVIADSMYYGMLHKLFLTVMDVFHFVIALGAFCFVILERKKINNNQLILALTIFGGFLFHMIWEAKGQYIMPYFVMLLPYAAAGINAVMNYFKTKQTVIRNTAFWNHIHNQMNKSTVNTIEDEVNDNFDENKFKITK